MKLKSSVLLAVVCLGVGVGIGLGWPRHWKEFRSVPTVTNTVFRRAEPGERPERSHERKLPALERLRAALADKNSIDVLACWGAISELTAQECREAIDLVRDAGNFNHGFGDGIALRWSRLDPEGLMEQTCRRRDDYVQVALSKYAGDAIVEKDLEGALAQLEGMPRGHKRNVAGRSILLAAAKKDPRRTAEFVARDKGFSTDPQIAMRVAGELARVSPEEAMKWVADIPVRTVREEAERSAWWHWAEAEPAAVVAKLSANPKKASELFDVIGQSWMRTDPTGVIQWMNGLTNRADVHRAMASIEFDVDELGMEKARELIAGAKDKNLRDRLLQIVSRNLAGKDVQEALAFLNEFEGGKLVPGALQSIVNQWVLQDAAGATQYLLGLPESEQKSEMLRVAIGSWGADEMENVTSYVQQMPTGKDRDVAMAQVVHMLSESDPTQGVNLLREIGDPETAGKAARTLLGQMVKTDPQSAVAIAGQLPEQAQAAAYAGLVGNWAEEAPHAAGEWINTLPPGNGRDAAVASFVREIQDKEPATAAQWAMSIEEPKERTEATMAAFQRWVESNTDGAAEWLQGADLEEGLRPFFEEELKRARDRKARGFE